ncbi:alpha/beta fold hydrolase [Sphingomonas sp. CFBP8993]|uniref:alpha/beta fold hydrolase n=1 Tax=Sphingomonas sp. CFBP8993 TaxID=3096526 RepID=UPI002A6B26FE|nr:alpha/beta fold hydrolase [Sphingomonas sp. CFBP8993]MDY0958047.1 alpha/beta fold hydrolase [Sphingomonas sp. CFBP8993]
MDFASQHGPRPLPLFLAMLRSEAAENPDLVQRAMAGLKRFQTASRERPMRSLPVRRRRGRVTLRDAGGGATASGRPVLFVPSLINPPSILDLSRDRSLIRWLRTRGCHPWLIDWGTPGAKDRDIDVAGHVERFLLPLIATFPTPPVLVGYCLGGTLALAAAARSRVAGLAAIAAPWHFSGYDDEARAAMAAQWAAIKPTSEALGLVPMEALQAGFWRLDPARTIAKYAAFADLDPRSEAARRFIRLEDWANQGAPLPHAFGRELFEKLIAQDRPGQGQWRVAGATVTPAQCDAPSVEFVATADRIVPAATAIGLSDRRAGGTGHVGMVVGGRAEQQLWQPLADWITALPTPR